MLIVRLDVDPSDLEQFRFIAFKSPILTNYFDGSERYLEVDVCNVLDHKTEEVCRQGHEVHFLIRA